MTHPRAAGGGPWQTFGLLERGLRAVPGHPRRFDHSVRNAPTVPRYHRTPPIVPHPSRPVTAAFLPLLLTGPACVDDAAEPRPNVVVILADDLGWGDVRAFNPGSQIPTPHLDRLAAGGMRLTDAHSPAAWCTPTRYSLLTGRYSFRGRPWDWVKQPVIAPHTPTLPGTLAAAGYRTAMVGKWHLGFDVDDARAGMHTGGPVDRGFETYFGIPASLDIPPYYYLRGDRPAAPPTGTIGDSSSPGWSPIQGAFWRAGGIAPGFEHAAVLPTFRDEAVGVIEAAAGDDRPFFLYLALASPHTPWLPAEEFAGTSDAGMYGDFVAQTDAAVGAVLDALDEAGAAENTLVVFASDNGPCWYDADEARTGHFCAGPYRGMKGDGWEGGHRVPVIARWPGRVPAGSTSDALLLLTDLFATTAAAADITLPDGAAVDSVNQLPVLLGEPSPGLAAAPRTEAVFEAIGERDVLRVKDAAGDWKYLPFLGSGGFTKPKAVRPEPGGPTGQLYDLSDDPGETRNLWSERPDVVERLRGRLGAVVGG